jgi:hypothetical protein
MPQLSANRSSSNSTTRRKRNAEGRRDRIAFLVEQLSLSQLRR